MYRLSLASTIMLVVSLATSAWLTCVGGLGMTAGAEIACCKAGHEQCPMKDTSSDCCKMQGQRTHQLSLVTADGVRPVITAPTASATLSQIPVIAPLLTRVPRFGSAQIVSTAASPPPHLLASALLI
jgi:hypothetical protein